MRIFGDCCVVRVIAVVVLSCCLCAEYGDVGGDYSRLRLGLVYFKVLVVVISLLAFGWFGFVLLVCWGVGLLFTAWFSV